jgi:hypothetical protein
MSILLPLRFGPAWMAAGFAMIAVILYLALIPIAGLIPANVSDKALHAVAFAGLMIWFCGVVDFRLAPRLALCLAAYGLLIELLQGLTATRQADYLDLFADIVGILAGWLLCAAGLRHWCTKLESWLAPRQS